MERTENSLGSCPPEDAYKLAQDAELDLVKIAPTAKPPVCKIIDYGKYKLRDGPQGERSQEEAEGHRGQGSPLIPKH